MQPWPACWATRTIGVKQPKSKQTSKSRIDTAPQKHIFIVAGRVREINYCPQPLRCPFAAETRRQRASRAHHVLPRKSFHAKTRHVRYVGLLGSTATPRSDRIAHLSSAIVLFGQTYHHWYRSPPADRPATTASSPDASPACALLRSAAAPGLRHLSLAPANIAQPACQCSNIRVRRHRLQ